jgi:large subunit ribosomal protein L1
MARGKKYKAAQSKFDRYFAYSLSDAVGLVKATSTTAFDGSIEVHLNLGIDPKQAEQQVRATVALPHGTGKKVRVIAFVTDDKIAEAKGAGAIEAGNEDLVAKIEGGWMEFDKAVAMPEMMRSIAKIARTLGQAGKMPNPKAGTVSPDVQKVVKDIMRGQVEFRNDKLSNLHNAVGKVSFSEEMLVENITTYMKAVMDKKPEKMKGNYIKTMTIVSTMGPGVKVDFNALNASA